MVLSWHVLRCSVRELPRDALAWANAAKSVAIFGLGERRGFHAVVAVAGYRLLAVMWRRAWGCPSGPGC